MLVVERIDDFTEAELDAAIDKYISQLEKGYARGFVEALFVADVPKSEWWQITHAAADASHNETKDAVLDALTILDDVPRGDLQSAIEDGDFAAAINLFDWRGFERALTDNLIEVFTKIAIRSGADTALEIGKGLDFDEDAILDFFARGAKIAAKRIVANTRKAVGIALRRLSRLGFSPFQIRAQLLSLVGLDAQSMNAAINAIDAAQEAGETVTEIKKLAEELGEEKLDNRLERISRFENLNVAQAAQEEAVNQHVEVKALKNVVKVWTITPDERVCPICTRLNNQRRKKDELFKDPMTGLDYVGPPAHQQCRCGLKYMQARRAEAVGVFVVDIRTPEGEQIILPSGVKVSSEPLEFHLAGKHDQKAHGRGKGEKRTAFFGGSKEELIGGTEPPLERDRQYSPLFGANHEAVRARIAAGGYEGMPLDVAADIAAKEMDISKNENYEEAFGIATKGKFKGVPVIDKAGSKSEVVFERSEMEATLGNDVVFTHNHPKDFGISQEDVALGFNLEAREMRAVSDDGTIYRVEYPRAPVFRSADEKKAWLDNKRKILSDAHDDRRNKWFPKVMSGKLPKNLAELEHHHFVMTEVADKLGVKYTRTGGKHTTHVEMFDE